jgi:hypothetical protein
MKYAIREANQDDIIGITEGFIEFCDEMPFEEWGWSFDPMRWSVKVFDDLVNNPNYKICVGVNENDYPIACCAGELINSYLDPVEAVCDIQIWYVRSMYRHRIPKLWLKIFNKICIWAETQTIATRIMVSPLVTSSPAVTKFIEKNGFIRHEILYHKRLNYGKLKQETSTQSRRICETGDETGKRTTAVCY